MTATENLSLSSAADEEHSYSKTKKVTAQKDHVRQVVTTVTAGGSAALSAGQDMTLTSSRVAANEEAYLVAGGKLSLLAAQDSDYSLYNKKSKGSFGSKKTKHDEVTDVTNIGTEIKTGGDLLLVSGGDQTYQAAKLDSGKDLTLNSGGAISFEGVKDLHQESHTKSNSNLAWNSAKGKGKTDETLKQSELVAQGEVAIHAVDGLNIDVKQVDQQTVSQAIDAMVQADPQLAWLKEAEKRGDVDWRQVKEIHESFKYSQSGLGAGAQLALAIALAVMLGPAGMGLSTTSAAVGGSLANTAINSAIFNKGNLGAVAKDTFSGYSLKNAAVAGFTAGLIDYADSTWFSGADGAANGGSKVITAGTAQNPGYAASMLKPENWAQTLVRSGAHAVITSGVSTAINGGSFGSNLGSALVGEGIDLGAALGNQSIGDIAQKLNLTPGTAGTILMHAMLGGVISMASGGDFKSGAIAGGAADGLTPIANEYLAQYVSDKFLAGDLSLAGSQYKITTAQIIGLISAGLASGNPAAGSMIGGAGEKYNQQEHHHVSGEAPQTADEAVAELKRELDVFHPWDSHELDDGDTVELLSPVPGKGLPIVGAGGKVSRSIPGLEEIDDFFTSQVSNLNAKLGTKIGQGRLPYEASKAGVEQAKATVKDTLMNATFISPLIPSSTVRGSYDLVHVYSDKTGSTVSLRLLPGGKYEFDTLIPEKSSKF